MTDNIRQHMTSSVAGVVKASSTMFHLYSRSAGAFSTPSTARAEVRGPSLVEACINPSATRRALLARRCMNIRSMSVDKASSCYFFRRHSIRQILLKALYHSNCDTISGSSVKRETYCNKNRLDAAPAFCLAALLAFT